MKIALCRYSKSIDYNKPVTNIIKMLSSETPFTRFNRLNNRLNNRLYRAYTIQPVEPVVQTVGGLTTAVEQSAASYDAAGCSTGCSAGLTTGYIAQIRS